MAEGYPKILIKAGPEEGQSFSLEEGESFGIGRSDNNIVVVTDSSVSRNHALITKKEDGYYIRDVGSSNGTTVNNQALQGEKEVKLTHLDSIQTGIYELAFVVREFSEEEYAKKKLTAIPVEDELEAGEEEELSVDEEAVTSVQPILENENEKQDTDNSPKSLISKYSLPLIATVFLVVMWTLALSSSNSKNKKKDDEQGHRRVSQSQNTDPIIIDLAKLKKKYAKHLQKTKVKKDTVKQLNLNSVSDDSSEKSVEKNITDENQDIKIVALDSTDINGQDQTKKVSQETENDNIVVQSVSSTKQKNDVEDMKVFLDVKAKPLAAQIYFQNNRLGVTPIKTNLSLTPGKKYELYADYELRDINDIYRKKVSFVAKKNSDVIELNISADIGVLKINKLPRNVEFYLEGYYDYDKLRANPVKLTDIIYGKPIYLPYGKYFVELKEKVSVAGSQNLITKIRFQREYQINEENPSLVVSVNDKDLETFPAYIKSDPTNAEVYYGGKLMGNTPFKGNFPIGRNQLKISKDGYFEKTVDVDMQMNSIYETTIKLKTSKVGELINKAKDLLRNSEKKQALEKLIEALKYGGSAKEKAEVYKMLGDAYLEGKQLEQALAYYTKAKSHAAFHESAILGTARVYLAQGQKNKALLTVIEILANMDKSTPNRIRAEANSVFKKISPVKSVIYIYTEPKGANVFLNDKKLSHQTPLILSDLGLGTYRLEVEKSGYESYKTKQNLMLGEFVTVKAKLKKVED